MYIRIMPYEQFYPCLLTLAIATFLMTLMLRIKSGCPCKGILGVVYEENCEQAGSYNAKGEMPR